MYIYFICLLSIMNEYDITFKIIVTIKADSEIEAIIKANEFLEWPHEELIVVDKLISIK